MIDPEEQRKRLLAIQDSLSERTDFPVLIVDDDEQDLFLTHAKLKEINVNSVTVKSGEVASEMIKQGGFAMIFLDWKLSGTSGLNTLKLVKAKCPDCIVIILSGVTSQDDSLTALKNGAAAVMSKPITDEQIRLIFHTPFP